MDTEAPADADTTDAGTGEDTAEHQRIDTDVALEPRDPTQDREDLEVPRWAQGRPDRGEPGGPPAAPRRPDAATPPAGGDPRDPRAGA